MTLDPLREGLDAFNRRDFFACHELLETAWKAAPRPIKPYLQGLIQVACGYYKLESGLVPPALRLFRRGLVNLAPCIPLDPWHEPLLAVREAVLRLEAGEDPRDVLGQAPRWPQAFASVEEAIWRLYNTSGGTNMLITRRFRFSAAHRYYDESLSPEENQRLFGKCAGVHGHGHNYVLDVSVRGPIDPKTGMIVNLKDLKAAVNARVIERYDFKHLNFDVDDFKGTQPTCEQLALTIWKLLDGQIPGCELARLRVYESDELFAEYEGQ